MEDFFDGIIQRGLCRRSTVAGSLLPGTGSPDNLRSTVMCFGFLNIFFWWCYANCITFAIRIIFLRYEHGIFFT